MGGRQSNSKSRTDEWVRNFFLVLFAVGVIVLFFNLDLVRKGESVFSHRARVKLHFRGDMGRKDFSGGEIKRIMRYLDSQSRILGTAVLETRLQDSYREVTDSSEVIFEVHLTMKDGTAVSTTARRASRAGLIEAVLVKLDKDVRAYRKLKRDGRDMKSLINTS